MPSHYPGTLAKARWRAARRKKSVITDTSKPNLSGAGVPAGQLLQEALQQPLDDLGMDAGDLEAPDGREPPANTHVQEMLHEPLSALSLGDSKTVVSFE